MEQFEPQPFVHLEEMGLAAAYSVGACLPSLRRLPSLQPQNCNNYSAAPLSCLRQLKCAVQLQPQVAPPSDESLLKRRTVLGLLTFDAVLAYSFFKEAPADEIPCQFEVAPSGLAFCDKLVGTGSQALKGQLIKAHYVGRLENGKVFDSSYNRGKPLTFRVGVGEVIKGWDEGIIGGDGIPPMLAGGKRTLKIPPELGYGSRGAGCRGGKYSFPFVQCC
ncbi:Peptidyl-prolyl cis-trans isomerase FKBP13, chloroplastic, partial [Mucuna pruriens]